MAPRPPLRECAGRTVERPPDAQLLRTLGIPSVLFLSIGAVIGTGIFVILGSAVPVAGPAVVLSFVVAGVACVLSGLGYAELAACLPSSGSVYSYAYASVGELVAWVVGWCLILEYGIGLAAISVGWSDYFTTFLDTTFDVTVPAWITAAPASGGLFDLPAFLVVLAGGWVVTRGVAESSRVTTVIVLMKLALLAFFVVVAWTGFNAGNLVPFLATGLAGMMAASSQLIFAYAGFDAAAVAGAEAKQPSKAIPVAILGGLSLVMVIYVVVSLAAVGAWPWTNFRQSSSGEAVLAQILVSVTGSTWPGEVMAIGAVVTILSAVLAQLYTLSRIIFSISRDGLLPRAFSAVSRRTRTPVLATRLVAGVVALVAALLPLDVLAESVSLGTLMAFVVVSAAVLVLRRRQPSLPRPFRLPLGPVVPVLAIVVNVYLMVQIRVSTWLVFVVWIIIGLVVYLTYGARNAAAGLPESQTADGLGVDLADALVTGLAESVDDGRHESRFPTDDEDARPGADDGRSGPG